MFCGERLGKIKYKNLELFETCRSILESVDYFGTKGVKVQENIFIEAPHLNKK